MTLKLKKRRKKLEGVEIFRQSLISALDVLNPCNELYLNIVNGSVTVNGEEEYPDEIVYLKDIERLIDKRNFYEAMSDEAKTIINFICFGDWEVILKLCGSSRGVTANGVAKIFRARWGAKKVRQAMLEIKNLLNI